VRDAILKDKPALTEWMITSSWDDGKPRVLPTMLVFVDEGTWKLCFNDRDGSRVAFLTGETLAGLLGALEEALANGGPEWRASKPWKAKR